MATDDNLHVLSAGDILKAVRWRFRICNTLFILGFGWIALALLGFIFSRALHLDEPYGEILLVVELIGLAIVSTGVALTFAIYRCPACDKYLSRFRPQKEKCPSCGATLWGKIRN